MELWAPSSFDYVDYNKTHLLHIHANIDPSQKSQSAGAACITHARVQCPAFAYYIIEMLCKHFRLCVCNFIYNSCIIKLENQGILFTEVLIAVTPLLIDLGVQNSERVTLSFKGLVYTDKPIIFSIVVNF